jgi:hypothetical protein
MVSTFASVKNLLDVRGGTLDPMAVDLARLLPSLCVGLSSKSPAGKKAARDTCALLASGLGSDAYYLTASSFFGLSSAQVNALLFCFLYFMFIYPL